MICFTIIPAANWNLLKLLYKNYNLVFLPPRHAPKARDHTKGCNGSSSSSFWLREITILIIIVVNGILSTKDEAIADTQRINKIEAANLHSLSTNKMTSSVWWPMKSIKPNRASAYNKKNDQHLSEFIIFYFGYYKMFSCRILHYYMKIQ